MLEKLSKPATADKIDNLYEVIDENGEKIIGTLTDTSTIPYNRVTAILTNTRGDNSQQRAFYFF